MHQLQANFYESPKKYCFETSNDTETITVPMLFRRLKILFVYPPWDWQTLRTLTSSKRTQNRNTPFFTEARVVRQTHSAFFTGGPSAVVCVSRRKCVVGKLRCNALALALGQTDCYALATTHHLCRLFVHVSVWLDRPHSPQTAPTPRRCDGSKDKKTKQTSVLDFAIWTIWQSISLCTRLPEGRQKTSQNSKSNSTSPRSHDSVGYKVRSSRPSAGKFEASPHARDDVEQRPPWRTP